MAACNSLMSQFSVTIFTLELILVFCLIWVWVWLTIYRVVSMCQVLSGAGEGKDLIEQLTAYEN